jgi:branched-chain amino acid transport system substrate-binding protein
MLLAACGANTVAEGPKPPQAAPGQAATKPLVLPPAPPPASSAGPAATPPVAAQPVQPLLPQTAIVGGTNRVALLVPLSGRDAALGRALLDAAELALFDFADENFTLLPFDTEAPGGARAAADQAVAAGAQLIIGPLFARQAPEVAAAASARGINVITFSNDRAVAGPNVYVFGLPPSQSVERVVAYARTQGIDSFAGLLPEDSFGARLAETLRSTVTAGGGTIVRLDTYPSAATDFNNPVRRAAEFDARVAHNVVVEETAGRTNDAKRRAAKMETTRPVDYQAILVAETGQRLRNMSALMAYYDIDTPKIRLLGTNAWEDPTLGREPGLVGAWFAAPDPALRANFEQHFQTSYNRAPPRLATLAYDATGLAAVLARHDGPADYSARALRDPSGFAGVDGIFRFGESGVVERGLAILEIQQKGLATIVPAPTSFEPPTQ